MSQVCESFSEAFPTVFKYEPASRWGRVVFLAGQIPKTGSESVYVEGRCGVDVDLEAAKESAKVAASQALAWLSKEIKCNERIEKILRVTVYVAVGPEFEDISKVADAASEVFSSSLGSCGKHPRSVVGVVRLPRNAPVLLEVTASLAPV